MRRLLFFVTILCFFRQAWAFPLNPDGSFRRIDPLAFLSDELFTADYNFDGIVSLGNCSGSLVRFAHSRDSDRAMVLTNGHCLGNFPRPGEVIVKRADRRSFSIMNPEGRSVGRVNAVQLLYATMTKTDMALYVLDKTHAQIAAEFRAQALTLARDYARVNDAIEIVSGYWRRGYTCAVEKIVYSLKESDWLMKDSLRYSRPGCETIGGTSGSPVILAGTRTVVGVNNTGNDSGRRCTMNNPCEIDENGNVFYQEGYSYGQQTSWIYSCLNDQGDLDLNRDGCQLPK